VREAASAVFPEGLIGQSFYDWFGLAYTYIVEPVSKVLLDGFAPPSLHLAVPPSLARGEGGEPSLARYGGVNCCGLV